MEEQPNELMYVDDDIRKEFEGKCYVIGLPTNVQLNRNLKALIDKLDLLNTPTEG